MLTPAQAKKLLPERRKDAHKGDFGHVLVVAGSRGMAGAAILSGLGALRSGAGLVTVAVPEGQQGAVTAAIPEALTVVLAGDPKKLLASKTFTAVALGPGLSTSAEGKRITDGFLRAAASLPLVIDADGLNCIAEMQPGAATRVLHDRPRPAVITPHPGELGRLLHSTTQAILKDRKASAREAVQRFGVVCLLKGHDTVIADESSVSINPTGNPGMAKGGMGDVLTGLIGGFLAQGLSPFDAARLGAYVHGLAGDIAVKKTGMAALLARDLAAALPEALRKLQ